MPLCLVLSCTTFSGAETPGLATRRRRPVALVQVQQWQRLLVANRDSGSISVIDTSTRSVAAENEIGGRLTDLVLRDDGHLLTLDEEKELANQLAKYPELIANSAAQREPHHLTHYLRELAGQFHTYYNAHKVLIEDTALRDARVSLYLAVRQVIANGLDLLGVSAPEEM